MEVFVEITLEVPGQFSVDRDPAELARHIKLSAALFMFQSGEISAGAAAELAGVDRFRFAEECQRHGLPLVDYPGEELRAELARMRGET